MRRDISRLYDGDSGGFLNALGVAGAVAFGLFFIVYASGAPMKGNVAAVAFAVSPWVCLALGVVAYRSMARRKLDRLGDFLDMVRWERPLWRFFGFLVAVQSVLVLGVIVATLFDG